MTIWKINSNPRDLLASDKCQTQKFLENIDFTHPLFLHKADRDAPEAVDLRMPISIVKPKIRQAAENKAGSRKMTPFPSSRNLSK